MDGQCIISWPNETIYKGQFTNGQKEGYGIFYFQDGSSYEGQWKNGKKHGIGIQSSMERVLNESEYKNGDRIRLIQSAKYYKSNEKKEISNYSVVLFPVGKRNILVDGKKSLLILDKRTFEQKSEINVDGVLRDAC